MTTGVKTFSLMDGGYFLGFLCLPINKHLLGADDWPRHSNYSGSFKQYESYTNCIIECISCSLTWG